MVKTAQTFAVAIFHGTQVLAVKRSPRDRYFPGLWGLPAGSKQRKESFDRAIEKVMLQKLGIKLGELKALHQGQDHRQTHIVAMTLFRAQILEGSPQVPPFDPESYNYTDVAWVQPQQLVTSRDQGSLCCRLLLEHFPINPAQTPASDS